MKRVSQFAGLWLVCGVLSCATARAELIRGQILEPDGEPAAGAQVWIQKADAEGEDTPITADGEGRFQLDMEAASFSSDYYGRLVAHKQGFAPAGGILRKTGNIFKLAEAVTVKGRVVDEQNQPVAGARVSVLFFSYGGDLELGQYVWIQSEQLKQKLSSVSDANGLWQIEAIPAEARVDVEILEPRFARTRKQLDAGQESTVKLQSGGEFTGRILFADGKPAVGVRIAAQPQDYSQNHTAWGEARTDADGSFTIASLSGGSYNLLVDAPDKDWVAAAIEGAVAVAGETKPVADVVLVKGALIEGKVTDEKGAPIPGVRIGSHGPHRPFSGAAVIGAVTDEDGIYRLRVAPGKSSAYVMGKPAEFLYPEVGSPYQSLEFHLQEGETKSVPFVLRRGLSISGIAKDEQGAPVENALLYFTRTTGNEPFHSREQSAARVDENGEWEAVGMVAGTWKVSARGEWEVVSPGEFQVPTQAKLEVTLRRAEFSSLRGRVVSFDGKPLAGAQANFNVTVRDSARSTSQVLSRTVSTDKQGHYTIEKLPSGYSLSLHSVSKAGYRFSKGGTVSKSGRATEITDIVLAPLNATLAGRVTDAVGKPVGGAKVLSPDTDGKVETVTDENGRFRLQQLAQGVVTIVVLHPEKGALSTTRISDGADVELKLVPHTPAPERDQARAEEILQDVWQQSMGTNYWQRSMLWMALLPYDFERAVELSEDAQGKLPEMFLVRAMEYLAKNDPAKAAEWGAPRLDEIENSFYRSYAMARLGVAVAEQNPQLAHTWYEQLLASAEGAGDASMMRWTILAQLAAKLQKPQAREFAEKAVEAGRAEGRNDEHSMGREAAVAEALVQADVAEAKRLLPFLSQNERASALQRMIRVLAQRGRADDIAAARDLLEQLKEIADRQNRNDSSSALLSLIPAVGKTDPAKALELARQVSNSFYKPVALATAAGFQEEATMKIALEEAAGAALNHQSSMLQLANIALLAQPKFPDLARKLLQQAQDLRGSANPDSYGLGSVEGIASIVAATAEVDRLAARELLELEWAKATLPTPTPQPQTLRELAVAAANVDFERALEMARSIPEDKDRRRNASYEAQRQLALWLMRPTHERNQPRGHLWSSVYSDEY